MSSGQVCSRGTGPEGAPQRPQELGLGLVKRNPGGMRSLKPGAQCLPVALRRGHGVSAGSEPVVKAGKKVLGKFHAPSLPGQGQERVKAGFTPC